MTEHPYERWLDSVRNPSQYVGNELHSAECESSGADYRIALSFPDLYRIGMSHLGMKILYSIVNSRQGLCAERFFMPETDMAEILCANNEPLRSLESHDPLHSFDVVGFSITTELSFTTVLKMLDMGRVPLKQDERKETHPLVIGGGAAIYNPEPIAVFFDMFVLGDAEELLPELLFQIADYKKQGLGRKTILRKLADSKGVYVPSLFNVTYHGPAGDKILPVDGDVPKPERLYLDDLAKSPYPFDMVIPYGQPVFDRLSVEIDRGCTQACRFCQAGFTYRPVRERSPELLLGIIDKGLKATGFDDVSLASLSSSDNSNIDRLVSEIAGQTVKDRISLSFPSLRSGTLTDNLIEQVRRVRKTGFTITAEAGTERLRRVINKKVSDDEIMETARKLLIGGWRRLKLYFMIGLPTETDEDIDGIVRMVQRIKGLKINGGRFSRINVGVSQFVPKPHTPFQWEPMESVDSLLRKKRYLQSAFDRIKGVNMKGHHVEMSYFEALMARGDRRFGNVILNAFNKGCVLDEWSEHFKQELWFEAFREEGISIDDFAPRRRAADEVLPWDHLEIGVSKKYFLRELSRAGKEVLTQDCRFDKCVGCGINPCNMVIKETAAKPATGKTTAQTDGRKRPEGWRYRIGFRKEGLSRYLSHLEMITAISRVLRRARIPVAYTNGMHPHQKLSFGAALSVGVISLCEFIDIELDESIDPSELISRLNPELEKGIVVYTAVLLSPPYRSIQASTAATIYELTDSAANEPALERLRDELVKLDGVTVSEPDSKTLRIETINPGILGRLRKIFPDFRLSESRKLVKTGILMKSMKAVDAGGGLLHQSIG
ncbi:MAG: TIGR03960 family B12-binding radical SAM protein [Nitrospinota bacterium]